MMISLLNVQAESISIFILTKLPNIGIKNMDTKKLKEAQKAKKDEFYTKLTDIEKELMHYKEMFVGKTIYCNCDDPVKSNFVQWFYMRFNILHLKRIIITAYNSATCNGGGIIGIPILLQWTRSRLISAKKLRKT